MITAFAHRASVSAKAAARLHSKNGAAAQPSSIIVFDAWAY